MEIPLSVEKLRKVYGDLEALKGMDFQMKNGEIFGLLGPNGAGKTTFISMVTGLISPSSGTGSIFGHDILKDYIPARRMLGVVPQEIISHGFFTVNQVLNFHSGFYGISGNQKRIDYLIERLGLLPQKQKLIAELSGGMKRRFMIAKALVHSPPLLLLDEPTAGVDVELRIALWEFVRELNESGTTILLTTHYLHEAEELCNRIGILQDGELITLDKTQNLIKNLTHRDVTITLTKPWNNLSAVDGLKIRENVIKTKIRNNETIGMLIEKFGIPVDVIQDISVDEGSLEEAFVNILEKFKNS